MSVLAVVLGSKVICVTGKEYDICLKSKRDANSFILLIIKLYLMDHPAYQILAAVDDRGSDKDFLFGISLSYASMNLEMCDKARLANHGVKSGLFFRRQCPTSVFYFLAMAG